MNKFIARDGQFWLNDQPLLIQAGEFHYYRTPRDQWRHRLELLKAAGFNAVAAYMPWLWHQVDEDVADFDGHSHPMRDLAGFLDLAAEMGLYIIARPGPYIMAESINEGIPQWIFKKYPQVAFLSQDHIAQNVVSYLHPDFLACSRKWYQAIFEVLAPRQVTRGGKILLVQLDNEMGMIAWVRNIIDINPHTMELFAAYLHKTYGAGLAERYPASSLVDFLAENISNPSEPYAALIVEDYRRFYRVYLRDYTQFLVDVAKANGLEVPPVINIHGFANGGKTFPIGISQLISVMDMDGMISATDVYPGHIWEGTYHQLLLVNEMTKAVHNKAQPLFSIEFQAGGNHDFGNGQASMSDLHTRICLSCGMRAINHYLFFGGENDPLISPVKRHDWGHPVRTNGTLRKHYARYPQLSRVINAYGADLTVAQPQVDTTIGYLLDYFMTEVNNKFTRPAADIITHQRDIVLFDMIGRSLALTHRSFNALEISRDVLEVSRTPLLWVMMDQQCDARTQQKLVDYIHQGGKLILAGRICVEDFEHHPCTILKDALGLQVITCDAPFTSANIDIFDQEDFPASFVESYSGHFEEVFARRKNGQVVGFIKPLGKGTVMVFGAAMYVETLEDLEVVDRMASRMGCFSPFSLSEWADVRFSRGKNGSFLFIHNYSDDPVETPVEYEHKDLFGGHAIQLPARRGMILPVEWQLDPEVLLHYATSEVTGVVRDGQTITIQTAQAEFYAELTLKGYLCDPACLAGSGDAQRVLVHGKEGRILLHKVL